MVTRDAAAHERLLAETVKYYEESLKFRSEARKLEWGGSKYRRETLYYPFVAGVGVAATIGAGLFTLAKQLLQ